MTMWGLGDGCVFESYTSLRCQALVFASCLPCKGEAPATPLHELCHALHAVT